MSFRTVNGSTRSEAGWRLVNRDECILVSGPYMNTAPLRAGAPASVLGEFVRRHHVYVEPIVGPVWGWSRDNDVLGSYGGNNGSNHLAGVAVDVRAQMRPWGQKVLSGAVVTRTYNLLEEFKIGPAASDCGVKWGREWNKPDEMHFQTMWPEGDPRWNTLLKKLGGLAPVEPPIIIPGGATSWAPFLQYGSQGAAVLELQKDMNVAFSGYEAMPLIVDGEFGPATASAVREFQRRSPDHLDVDGKVGPLTWASLSKYGVKL